MFPQKRLISYNNLISELTDNVKDLIEDLRILRSIVGLLNIEEKDKNKLSGLINSLNEMYEKAGDEDLELLIKWKNKITNIINGIEDLTESFLAQTLYEWCKYDIRDKTYKLIQERALDVLYDIHVLRTMYLAETLFKTRGEHT